MPDIKPLHEDGVYDIYPSFRLNDNIIFDGFESLAGEFRKHKQVIIDGYAGVYYDLFCEKTDEFLKQTGVSTSWLFTSGFFKTHSAIEILTAPYTGGDDPLFGKRTDLDLDDFFDIQRLKNVKASQDADINFIIGPGAALAGWDGLLVYLDIPKNEIQFRSRAGTISNLGASVPGDPKAMYKRFYFIDWVVLNKHRKTLAPRIDIIIDTQKPDHPVWMAGDHLRNALSALSHNMFRVRPWFEPGAWGGTWIKEHIRGLNRDVPNYAWSFELIVPENGLLFESSGKLLEVAFDTLMIQEGEAVLGSSFPRFGTEFPIRFDFLDTFDGGNLSIQCHPRPEYMKNHFGENFTQEETYYILDCKENPVVYLGFQNDIDPAEFRNELEESYIRSKPLDIDKFVQKHSAKKHDLFLIPSGTIHGSGKNNLVLEISSTPYIFTFKMYDWLRADLDGKPRTLNINRGMDNLSFDRKGDYIKENLIPRPGLIDRGSDWQLFHLPTHETQLYDIHRFHFMGSVEVKTENRCHVLSLVEGTEILVETQNGFSARFSYAETFVIPASAGVYRIINKSGTEAIVIKAFIK